MSIMSERIRNAMEIHRRVIEQELEDIESGRLTKEEEWAARVRLESSQKMLKQLEKRVNG